MTTESENPLSLYNEVAAYQRAWAKKHTLPENAGALDIIRAHNRMSMDMSQTVLSFVRDLAQGQGQHMIAINDLAQGGLGDEGSDETQFTLEDAERFARLLEYTETIIKGSLDHGPTEDQRKVLEMFLADVVYCRQCVDDNTLEDDDGEGDEDDVEESPEAVLP